MLNHSMLVYVLLLATSAEALRIHPDQPSETLGCKTVVLSPLYHQKSGGIQRLEGFEKFHRSVHAVSEGDIEAIVMHDGLPENFTSKYTTTKFHFQKMTAPPDTHHLCGFSKRFLMAEELIQAHPEWDVVFLTDLTDVKIHHNPCGMVQQNSTKMFVGSELPSDFSKRYMTRYIAPMGGKWVKYWNEYSKTHKWMYNAGISGGKRDLYLKFLSHFRENVMDPNSMCKQTCVKLGPEECSKLKHETCKGVDMGVFQYVVTEYYSKDDIVTGYPLHSDFGKFAKQTDAAIQHKFSRQDGAMFGA